MRTMILAAAAALLAASVSGAVAETVEAVVEAPICSAIGGDRAEQAAIGILLMEVCGQRAVGADVLRRARTLCGSNVETVEGYMEAMRPTARMTRCEPAMESRMWRERRDWQRLAGGVDG